MITIAIPLTMHVVLTIFVVFLGSGIAAGLSILCKPPYNCNRSCHARDSAHNPGVWLEKQLHGHGGQQSFVQSTP
eukprot:1668347-Amphidinium_carterae.1